MSVAIRIVRTENKVDHNNFALEREEQIIAVAQRVVEASGQVSRYRIEECAEKIRAAGVGYNQRSIDQVVGDVTWRVSGVNGSSLMNVHAKMDMDRILALLEG